LTIHCHQLAHHSLYIRDPGTSLDFYQRVLGMTLYSRLTIDDREHLFLGFNAAIREQHLMLAKAPHCLLQLVFDPTREFDNRAEAGDRPIGYWKIALSVADLNIAHGRLLEKGITVNNPFQVPDVAYLCHCEDPDGYCVELIQHRFQQNHVDLAPDDRFALGTPTSFSLIT
jgi:predicted enzyme related to lactoylglutathione lyase